MPSINKSLPIVLLAGVSVIAGPILQQPQTGMTSGALSSLPRFDCVQAVDSLLDLDSQCGGSLKTVTLRSNYARDVAASADVNVTQVSPLLETVGNAKPAAQVQVVDSPSADVPPSQNAVVGAATASVINSPAAQIASTSAAQVEGLSDVNQGEGSGVRIGGAVMASAAGNPSSSSSTTAQVAGSNDQSSGSLAVAQVQVQTPQVQGQTPATMPAAIAGTKDSSTTSAGDKVLNASLGSSSPDLAAQVNPNGLIGATPSAAMANGNDPASPAVLTNVNLPSVQTGNEFVSNINVNAPPTAMANAGVSIFPATLANVNAVGSAAALASVSNGQIGETARLGVDTVAKTSGLQGSSAGISAGVMASS